MIKIEFTCYVCGNTSEIGVDNIEEKTIVPVCEGCYNVFVSQNEKLIRLFVKKLTGVYNVFSISIDSFNAGEDIIVRE